MTFKSASRVLRLISLVVSPLLTAPAAADDLQRGLLARTARGDDLSAVHARACAGRAPASDRGRRGRAL